MAVTKDWLPISRTAQLRMAKDWMTVMAANSGAWGIPQDVLAGLDSLAQIAESALEAAQSESARTPAATAQCKSAFDGMTAKMRDIKKRYFFAPPLTDAAIVSLGLSPRDAVPSQTGTPSAQVTVEIGRAGRHKLGVSIVYVTGSPGDTANKGYRIWYSAVSPEETPPAEPGGLRHSFFTKRKKDVIEFDLDDSGKTAYLAVQVENDGKKGPWGPLVSALIP